MNLQSWINATPEQINFWNQVKGIIAWNTITPLFYQGTIAGSEFTAYDADKLYIALELSASSSTGFGTSAGTIALYDELNAVSFYGRNNDIGLTAADVKTYTINNVVLKNVYFGRIVVGSLTQMVFNGYRLDV